MGPPTSAADLTSHSNAWLQALTLRLASQPLAAACCYLSVDDLTRAVVVLLGGGEWEMAHALAHALPVPEALQHETRHQLALACEAAGTVRIHYGIRGHFRVGSQHGHWQEPPQRMSQTMQCLSLRPCGTILGTSWRWLVRRQAGVRFATRGSESSAAKVKLAHALPAAFAIACMAAEVCQAAGSQAAALETFDYCS